MDRRCSRLRLGILAKITTLIRRYYARLGTVSIADKSFNEITDYEVEEFVVHENYGTTAAYSDIGLLRLRKIVEFDKKLRFPACLQHTELTTTNATAVSSCLMVIS